MSNSWQTPSPYEEHEFILHIATSEVKPAWSQKQPRSQFLPAPTSLWADAICSFYFPRTESFFQHKSTSHDFCTKHRMKWLYRMRNNWSEATAAHLCTHHTSFRLFSNLREFAKWLSWMLPSQPPSHYQLPLPFIHWVNWRSILEFALELSVQNVIQGCHVPQMQRKQHIRGVTSATVVAKSIEILFSCCFILDLFLTCSWLFHVKAQVDVFIFLSDGQSRILQNLHHSRQEFQHDVAVATRKATIQNLHFLVKNFSGKRFQKFSQLN